MEDEKEPQFSYTVESDEDETEVAFVVKSLHGQRVSQEDFVDQIEEYLDEIYGRNDRIITH